MSLDDDLSNLKRRAREIYERYRGKGWLRFTGLHSILDGLCGGRLAFRPDEDGVICGLGVETPLGVRHAVKYKMGDEASEMKAMDDLVDWAWENGGRAKIQAIYAARAHDAPLDLSANSSQNI